MSSLLTEWQNTKKQFDIIKALELKLRNQLISELFPDQREGSQSVDVSADLKLTVTQSMARSIDVAAYDAILNELSDRARSVVVHQPKLDTRAYKALPEEDRFALDACVISKPSQPQLKLSEIKNAEQ